MSLAVVYWGSMAAGIALHRVMGEKEESMGHNGKPGNPSFFQRRRKQTLSLQLS